MLGTTLLASMHVATQPPPIGSGSDLTELGFSEVERNHAVDIVLLYVLAVFLLVLCWYGVRALARRDVRGASWLYQRLDPQAQALQVWFARAPATLVYVACFTATTVIVEGSPPLLVDALTRFNSTNIVGIVTEPVRSLMVSALLVANNGTGFMLYAIVFVVFVARLEHRLGTPRTVTVWFAAHVGGSLLTVAIEVLAIDMNWAHDRLAVTADVGVSYVMVGSLGAYIWLVTPRWRPWYLALLFVTVAVPVLLSFVLQIWVNAIWNIGHLIATTIGFVTGWAVLAIEPPRPRFTWRLVSSGRPRELKPIRRRHHHDEPEASPHPAPDRAT